MTRLLEFQAALAGRLRQGFHPAMKHVAAAVEHDRIDARRFARSASNLQPGPRLPCHRRFSASLAAPPPGSTRGKVTPLASSMTWAEIFLWLRATDSAGARAPAFSGGCALRWARRLSLTREVFIGLLLLAFLACAHIRRHSAHPCPCRAQATDKHGFSLRPAQPPVCRSRKRPLQSALGPISTLPAPVKTTSWENPRDNLRSEPCIWARYPTPWISRVLETLGHAVHHVGDPRPRRAPLRPCIRLQRLGKGRLSACPWPEPSQSVFQPFDRSSRGITRTDPSSRLGAPARTV